MEYRTVKSRAILLYSVSLDDQYSHNGDSDGMEDDVFDVEDAVSQKKADRKAAKKAVKVERRAQREGKGDPTAGQKIVICVPSLSIS